MASLFVLLLSGEKNWQVRPLFWFWPSSQRFSVPLVD